MLKESEVRSWIERSYMNACSKGFHDEKRSIPHWFMLSLSEVSEAVESDRRNRHADLVSFEGRLANCSNFKEAFEKYVKDTVEDELADVVIRLCDTCGEYGIVPNLSECDNKSKFDELFGSWSFCERCYALCELICSVNEHSSLEEDSAEWVIGSALDYVDAMCEDLGIDLRRHVELKMSYNELRPAKHGKAY